MKVKRCPICRDIIPKEVGWKTCYRQYCSVKYRKRIKNKTLSSCKLTKL